MIQIVFEDNHLLVLDKPPGLLTQPSGSDQDSLEAQAKSFIKIRDQKKGGVFLEAVHRLDKDTSGIVLFAKTSKALARVSESIRRREVKKVYQAWVEGSVKESTKTLENYLLHETHFSKVVKKETKQAKFCRLSYRVMKQEKNKALLEIDLETGRYHQIRAQLSHCGFPVVGDRKYGSKLPYPKPGIALNHCKFTLKHPITKEEMTFLVKDLWTQ